MSTTSSGRFDRICGLDGIFRLNYKTHGFVDFIDHPNQARRLREWNNGIMD